MIGETHVAITVTANTALIMHYLLIGDWISREMLKGKRADYWAEIVSTLSRQLSCSHFKQIINLPQPLRKKFYAGMRRTKRFSVRTLQKNIISIPNGTIDPHGKGCR
jgi:hypothetical protein